MVKKREDCTPEELAERDAFAEKVRSISFAASAMPSRSNAAAEKKAWKNMDADLGAYKRLRADGEQPPDITGSAELEAKAESTHEVTAGRIVRNKKSRDEAGKILAEAKADS